MRTAVRIYIYIYIYIYITKYTALGNILTKIIMVLLLYCLEIKNSSAPPCPLYNSNFAPSFKKTSYVSDYYSFAKVCTEAIYIKFETVRPTYYLWIIVSFENFEPNQFPGKTIYAPADTEPIWLKFIISIKVPQVIWFF